MRARGWRFPEKGKTRYEAGAPAVAALGVAVLLEVPFLVPGGAAPAARQIVAFLVHQPDSPSRFRCTPARVAGMERRMLLMAWGFSCSAVASAPVRAVKALTMRL